MIESKTTDKYKMFKNYMHNELGISRDDINQWVRDTIKETINNFFSKWNMKEYVLKIAERQIKEGFARGRESDYVKSVRMEVANIIAAKIEMSINEANQNG